MSQEPPAEVRGAVDTLRTALASFPVDSYRIVRDWAPTWAEEEYDYFVSWEIRVEPVAHGACPFEVSFVEAPAPWVCCGFGFDSVARLAQRLQLKGGSGAHSKGFMSGALDEWYVFGFEPIRLRNEQIATIVRAVFEGRAEARYWTAFGHLLSCSGGLLANVGTPLARPKRWGNRRYRYAPYAPAP